MMEGRDKSLEQVGSLRSSKSQEREKKKEKKLLRAEK
jgi:hypothetical protein